MASLTGNQVGASYLGIIKTLDNTAITASPKQLTDGAGNALTMCASSSSVIFTGTADFSAATVVGISSTDTTYDLSSAQSGSDVTIDLTGSDSSVDTITLYAGPNITLVDDGLNGILITAEGGNPGLVNGTGSNSMQSSATLTTVPADASGNDAVALGNCACARGNCSIAIGFNTQVFDSSRPEAIAIGKDARVAQCSIAIGASSDSVDVATIALGWGAQASIGTGAIAIGCAATAVNAGTVALGRGVTATRSNHVTSCAFEACVAGKGIVVKSPNGLCTLGIGIDNAGNIITYTP